MFFFDLYKALDVLIDNSKANFFKVDKMYEHMSKKAATNCVVSKICWTFLAFYWTQVLISQYRKQAQSQGDKFQATTLMSWY